MEILTYLLLLILLFFVLGFVFKVIWYLLPFILIFYGVMYFTNAIRIKRYKDTRQEAPRQTNQRTQTRNDDVIDVEFKVRDENDQ